MTSFRDWSIRHKLTGLFMAMACITTVAISLPLGLFDLWGTRTAMARELVTLTDVLARNSTAAITFRDADAARDVLQALQAEPSITVACVYTGDGKPFAKYVRQGEDSGFVPPPPQAQTTVLQKDTCGRRFPAFHLAGQPPGRTPSNSQPTTIGTSADLPLPRVSQRGDIRSLWKDSAGTAIGRAVARTTVNGSLGTPVLAGVPGWRSRRRILLSE